MSQSCSQGSGPERRRGPRVAFDREVVALDADGRVAMARLVGRDLSAGVLRVDPDPALALGQRLRIALVLAGAPGALVIEAEVWRDDGSRGWALRFVDLHPEMVARIDALLADLPAAQAPAAPSPAVVVGSVRIALVQKTPR